MQNRERYVYKWHRNPQIVSLFNIGILMVSLVALYDIMCHGGHFLEKTERPAFIVFLSLFIINLLLFIYSFYFGWNRPIYLNEEKVWQKIKGKLYEWRWEDMTKCFLSRITFKNPIIIHLETVPEQKELQFAIGRRRYEKIMELCPNDSIKEQLVEEYKKFLV